MTGLPTATARVAAALADAGLVVDVRAFSEGTRTAVDAARAVGCEVGQIVKSLVFERRGVAGAATGRPEAVLVCCGGDGTVDAARLGLGKADAASVRAATGFAIGGVPPVGWDPAEVLVDERLLDHRVVFAAAGTPTTVFAIAPGDLVRVTGGTVGPVRPA